jgi:hypothetical protein
MPFEPFSWGSDGWRCDQGHRLTLWALDDFQRFWNALERAVDAPLGRKLIYAMADAEERIHAHAPSVGWFRKRTRLQQALRVRRQRMGWGELDRDARTVSQGVLPFIEMGTVLAHEEHLSGRRFNLEWNQPTASTLRYALTQRNGEMVAAPLPTVFEWSSHTTPSNETWGHSIDVDRRTVGWFINEQRCFFMPASVFSYLAASLQTVEFSPPMLSAIGLAVEGLSSAEERVFSSLCWSAFQACINSDRMVFFHTSDELDSVLNTQHRRLGLGSVKVDEFIDAATFVLVGCGEHTPISMGWLMGLLTMGSGHRLQAHLVLKPNEWRLEINPEKISYVGAENASPQP